MFWGWEWIFHFFLSISRNYFIHGVKFVISPNLKTLGNDAVEFVVSNRMVVVQKLFSALSKVSNLLHSPKAFEVERLENFVSGNAKTL